MIFFFLLIIVLILIDVYALQGIKVLTTSLNNSSWALFIQYSYWFITWGSFIILLYGMYQFRQTHSMSAISKWALNMFVTLFVTKIFFIIILFSEDLFRLIQGTVSQFSSTNHSDSPFLPSRRLFFSQVALGIASVPFVAFLYGVTKGKYNYKVHRQILYFDNLPETFEGFTITQISDIHSGSFDDIESVKKGVELAKGQQSDLFVFTGDLVNNVATEIEPYIDLFSKIEAPHGKYSILGNHDYGDYISWPNDAEKVANLNLLKKQHSKMGFSLLLDEHITLEKNGEKIYLLGVENWGVGFGKRGNLEKSLNGLNATDFKILLSHDPSHWEQEVKQHPNKINLTLSGHTHGAQMGVEIPGFKWSPVQFRYAHWAGLKIEFERSIYINRGFGFLAFAGRVGIWPEITVLELRRTA